MSFSHFVMRVKDSLNSVFSLFLFLLITFMFFFFLYPPQHQHFSFFSFFLPSSLPPLFFISFSFSQVSSLSSFFLPFFYFTYIFLPPFLSSSFSSRSSSLRSDQFPPNTHTFTWFYSFILSLQVKANGFEDHMSQPFRVRPHKVTRMDIMMTREESASRSLNGSFRGKDFIFLLIYLLIYFNSLNKFGIK